MDDLYAGTVLGTEAPSNGRKLRLCIVCQNYQLSREYLPTHQALERAFELTRFFVDGRWPSSIRDIPDYQDFDAVLWFVRYRELIGQPAFDWGDFRGMRLMYEQDAYQNFSTLISNRYLGTWPGVYRKHRFDALLCTGEATRDNLGEAGVNAIWVPKAYDAGRFFDRHEARDGIGYFGELYDARAAMLRHLRKSRIAVQRFRCTFFELNHYLNRFSMCVICNMALLRPADRSRLLDWVIPERLPRLLRGPEVMLKNFEVAATGCVPVCDEIPEMEKLGFIDGQTMVSYRNFSELVDKLKWYLEAPDALREISSRAALLCATRHTWDHRARQIRNVVASHVPRERT